MRYVLDIVISLLDNASVFFFFSSRRRHTRYWRDWSSDVCSSDLSFVDPYDPIFHAGNAYTGMMKGAAGNQKLGSVNGIRSEERRVGKECRSRWSPYH